MGANFTIETHQKVTPELLDQIEKINHDIFVDFADPFSREKLENTINNVAGLHLLLARSTECTGELPAGAIAGFKMGYRHSGAHFYSWLGGVKKEYRGRGLARLLMQK